MKTLASISRDSGGIAGFFRRTARGSDEEVGSSLDTETSPHLMVQPSDPIQTSSDLMVQASGHTQTSSDHMVRALDHTETSSDHVVRALDHIQKPSDFMVQSSDLTQKSFLYAGKSSGGTLWRNKQAKNGKNRVLCPCHPQTR
jgi:hypothetical protein